MISSAETSTTGRRGLASYVPRHFETSASCDPSVKNPASRVGFQKG